MAKTLLFGTLTALLILSGIAFAGMSCAADAYRYSCQQCSFDASGKMDQKCYQEKKSAGISCVAANHAIASAAYAAGKCPGIEACASDLQKCQAQMGTGNDSADCAEGSTGTCFVISDQCVDKAARDCGEKPPDCKPPAALILLVVGLAFVGAAKK